MSTSTLSSSSGLSDRLSNSKRALSDSEELDERTTKKTRTVPDDQHNGKRDAKEKKKRQKKKKKKHSVVTVEDGRARVKDSRRGVSSFLDTTDVEGVALLVKPGESSNTRSKPPTGSLDNLLEERDVEHIVSCHKDKGKGKATEPSQPETEIQPGPSSLESAEEQMARLTKELAFKNELIEQHQSAFNHVQQTITCQVCLELMHKPYALSPCGHLACYDCLVSWFKAPPLDDRAAPPVPYRKKSCPHCRAVVKDRPVQVWGVKSIVSNLSKSGLLQGTFLTPDEPTQNANDNADPWNGIFHKIGRGFGHGNVGHLEGGVGIEDGEDGVYRCYDCMHEIWDGICSNCGREYHADDDDFSWGPDLIDEEEDFDDEFRWGVHRILGAAGNAHPDEPLGLAVWAAADGLRAPAPLRLPSEGPSDDEREEGYESSFIDDENDVGIPRGNLRRIPAVIDITSESEGEEPARRRPSSNRQGTRSSRLDPIEVSDGDEVQEIRRSTRSRGDQTRRRSGPLGAGSIIIVSDQDDEDVSSPRRGGSAPRVSSSRPSHRTRNRIESTDEDDGSDNESDGIDPGLAELVDARERELYGDDGSVSRRHEHREDDVEHSSADEDGYDSGDRSYFGRYDMPIDESDCGSSQEDLYSW